MAEELITLEELAESGEYKALDPDIREIAVELWGVEASRVLLSRSAAEIDPELERQREQAVFEAVSQVIAEINPPIRRPEGIVGVGLSFLKEIEPIRGGYFANARFNVGNLVAVRGRQMSLNANRAVGIADTPPDMIRDMGKDPVLQRFGKLTRSKFKKRLEETDPELLEDFSKVQALVFDPDPFTMFRVKAFNEGLAIWLEIRPRAIKANFAAMLDEQEEGLKDAVRQLRERGDEDAARKLENAAVTEPGIGAIGLLGQAMRESGEEIIIDRKLKERQAEISRLGTFSPAKVADTVGNTIPLLALAIAAEATGGPIAGFVVTREYLGGLNLQEYQEKVATGEVDWTDKEVFDRAMNTATFQALFERILPGRMAKAMRGKMETFRRFVKELGTDVGIEIFTESVQEGMAILGGTDGVDNLERVIEILFENEENFNRMVEAGKQGGVASVVLSGTIRTAIAASLAISPKDIRKRFETTGAQISAIPPETVTPQEVQSATQEVAQEEASIPVQEAQIPIEPEPVPEPVLEAVPGVPEVPVEPAPPVAPPPTEARPVVPPEPAPPIPPEDLETVPLPPEARIVQAKIEPRRQVGAAVEKSLPEGGRAGDTIASVERIATTPQDRVREAMSPDNLVKWMAERGISLDTRRKVRTNKAEAVAEANTEQEAKRQRQAEEIGEAFTSPDELSLADLQTVARTAIDFDSLTEELQADEEFLRSEIANRGIELPQSPELVQQQLQNAEDFDLFEPTPEQLAEIDDYAQQKLKQDDSDLENFILDTPGFLLATDNIATLEALMTDVRENVPSLLPKLEQRILDLRELVGDRDFAATTQRLLEKADADAAQVRTAGAGIAPPAPRGLRPDEVPDAVKAPDAEVERRLKESHGIRALNLVEKAIDKATTLWNAATRVNIFLPADDFHFPMIELMRLFGGVPDIVKDQASRMVAANITDLGPQKLALYTRKLLTEDLAAGLVQGNPLRYGYTPETLEAHRKSLDEAIAQTPDVQEALRRRAEMLRSLQIALRQAGKIDDEAANNPSYFRHQILDRVNLLGVPTGRRIKDRPKPSFAKRRVKSRSPEKSMSEEFDPNTNYIEVEAEFVTQALFELQVESFMDETGEGYDLMESLKDQAKQQAAATGESVNWRTLVPKDHTSWSPGHGSIFYPSHTLPEKIIEAFNGEQVKEMKISKDDLRKVLVLGGKSREMILPKTIVKQLDLMNNSPTQAQEVLRIGMESTGLWKIWTLLNPKRAPQYMFRNFTGDIDVVIAAAPRAILKTPRALKELSDFYYGNKLALPKDLKDARDRSVISASFTAQELPDLATLRIFERFYEGATKSLPEKAARLPLDAFRQITRFNEFRESILRYSTYLWYLEQIKAGKPFHYGGSKKSFVDALRTPEDKAAHLSRNLIGDYGNLTVMGRILRATVMPFWSWNEINIKRYPRLLINSIGFGKDVGAVKGLVSGGIVGLGAVLRMGALYAAFQVWNRLIDPEAEDELAPWDQQSPHILWGRADDGKILMLRNAGALGDFLEWFGVNEVISMLPFWKDQQISTTEMFQTMGEAPINKAAQALGPQVKLPLEMLTQTSMFPDAFTPRYIDRQEAIFNAFSLGEEHKWARKTLFGSSRAVPFDDPESYFTRWVAGVADPRVGNLQQIYDLRTKYLKKIGRESPGFFKPAPTTDMRRAGQFGDFKAFQNAKKAYREQGRDFEDFLNWTERSLDPIGAKLNDDDEILFTYQFLNDKQRKQLESARVYMNEIRDKLIYWWLLDEGKANIEEDELEALLQAAPGAR